MNNHLLSAQYRNTMGPEMLVRRLALIVALVLSLSTMALADFQDGVDAYERGDYAAALEEFRVFADFNFAPAQFYLGLMYENGLGLPKDSEEAAKWYSKAAELGYAPAQHAYGDSYYFARGVSRDYSEAARWYRRAAEQGHMQAQVALGYLYMDGMGVPKDNAESAKWFRLAEQQGYSFPQGPAFPQGYYIPTNQDQFGEGRADLLMYTVIVVLLIVPFWRICIRIGKTPVLSLLSAIPVLGIVLFAIIIASSRWPSFDNRAGQTENS